MLLIIEVFLLLTSFCCDLILIHSKCWKINKYRAIRKKKTKKKKKVIFCFWNQRKKEHSLLIINHVIMESRVTPRVSPRTVSPLFPLLSTLSLSISLELITLSPCFDVMSEFLRWWAFVWCVFLFDFVRFFFLFVLGFVSCFFLEFWNELINFVC